MTKKEKNFENFNVLGIDVGGTFTDLIYVDKENNVFCLFVFAGQGLDINCLLSQDFNGAQFFTKKSQRYRLLTDIYA